jgi:hypothetical protein
MTPITEPESAGEEVLGRDREDDDEREQDDDRSSAPACRRQKPRDECPRPRESGVAGFDGLGFRQRRLPPRT